MCSLLTRKRYLSKTAVLSTQKRLIDTTERFAFCNLIFTTRCVFWVIRVNLSFYYRIWEERKSKKWMKIVFLLNQALEVTYEYCCSIENINYRFNFREFWMWSYRKIYRYMFILTVEYLIKTVHSPVNQTKTFYAVWIVAKALGHKFTKLHFFSGSSLFNW